MNCRVCDTELSEAYGICPYCGYRNVALMNPFSDDSSNYRDTLLRNIKRITAMANCFRYDKGKKEFKQESENSLFEKPFEGADCYKRSVYSDRCLAHFEGTADLTISYEYGGKKHNVTVPVHFDEQEGLWRLGLQINNRIRLEVWRLVDPLQNSGQKRKQSCLGTVGMVFPLPSSK